MVKIIDFIFIKINYQKTQRFVKESEKEIWKE